VILVDTNKEQDVQINDTLIHTGYADFVTIPCFKQEVVETFETSTTTEIHLQSGFSASKSIITQVGYNTLI
jgi:hypothetical protein